LLIAFTVLLLIGAGCCLAVMAAFAVIASALAGLFIEFWPVIPVYMAVIAELVFMLATGQVIPVVLWLLRLFSGS
jgi:hypothetical protein